MAVRWALQRPLVSSVIIGPRTIAQVHDNLTAAQFELSEAHMQRLSQANQRDMPYPFDLITQINNRTLH